MQIICNRSKRIWSANSYVWIKLLIESAYYLKFAQFTHILIDLWEEGSIAPACKWVYHPERGAYNVIWQECVQLHSKYSSTARTSQTAYLEVYVEESVRFMWILSGRIGDNSRVLLFYLFRSNRININSWHVVDGRPTIIICIWPANSTSIWWTASNFCFIMAASIAPTLLLWHFIDWLFGTKTLVIVTDYIEVERERERETLIRHHWRATIAGNVTTQNR